MTAKFDPAHAVKRGYTRADWEAVESPEMSDEEIANDRPFSEALPELGAAMEQARRGRPPSENPKQMVSIRLDRDLVTALRASGRGWQTRANEILREAMGLGKQA